MKFYGYFRSSAAYRCRIAFNLKGVTPDFAAIHLRKGEQRSDDYLKHNPQGLVPALVTSQGTFIQSLAIMEWLDETHPAPPLLPTTAAGRAHVRALAQIVACDIHPLQNLRVLSYLRENYAQDQAGLDAWCSRWIEDGLNAYEQLLNANGRAGAFSYGDTPTIADACLIPQIFSATRFGADISKLSTIQRIAKNCEAHPAFAAAHPARQPDTEA